MSEYISPKNTSFILLSFEGPDKYSLIGGLGTRIVELSKTISEHGFENHLYFVGDPSFEKTSINQKTILHRECGPICEKYPENVYSGEHEKIKMWNETIPVKIIKEAIIPAAQKGMMTVIMAEDWHTADSVIIIDQLLKANGLRDYCVILWNINNEYGLGEVRLSELSKACTITTVSDFMTKRIKALYGIDAAPIPNGIPSRVIGEPSSEMRGALRSCFNGMLLQKVARYDSDKNWISAIETLSLLKKAGCRPCLLMRGGAQMYRSEVISRINDLGLSYVTVALKEPNFEMITDALRRYSHFDIIEMDFFIPEDLLMVMYGTADIVFANSVYEPFGIVGLEVMAKKGIAVLGCTGEDYASDRINSIRTDSENPEELKNTVIDIMNDAELREKIRENGLKTAKTFTWDRALSILIDHIEAIAKDYNIREIGIGKLSKDAPMLAML